MALPVTITDGVVGDQNSYHGPFKSSGGAFYTLLRRNGTSGLGGWKATDPTDSFTEQDTGNRPAFGIGGLRSVWLTQDGDDLHSVSQVAARDVWYARFDMANDIWDAIDGASDRDIEIESITTPDDGPGANACSIAVESTGSDIVVAYQGDPDMVAGTEYARIDANRSDDSGATWGGPIAIDNAGADHWTGPVIVLGSSDRFHIFFKNDDLNDAFQRRLGSDDSLETFPSSFDTTLSAADPTYPFGAGSISYDDGGTQKVRVSYRDFSNKATMAELDSADTPTVSGGVQIGDADNIVVNSTLVAGIAADGTDEHALMATLAQDLFHDVNTGAGWGTDTEVLDAVTVNHVSPNSYDRSGIKLAYIYDDGGTVKYNEVELAAAAPSGTGAPELGTFSMTAVGEQPHEATGAPLLGVMNLTAVGVMLPDGAGVLNLQDQVMVAVGEQPHEGVGSLLLGLLASGFSSGFDAGFGGNTTGVFTMTAVGVMEADGVGAPSLESFLLTASGNVAQFVGAVVLDLSGFEVTASGLMLPSGMSVLDFAQMVLVAIGEQPHGGVGVLNFTAQDLTAVGIMEADGVGVPNLEAMLLVAVGEQPHEGVGAPDLAQMVLVAVGEQPYEGVGAPDLEQLLMVAQGVMQPTAVAALDLADQIMTAVGVAGAPEGVADLLFTSFDLDAQGVMLPSGVGTPTLEVFVLSSTGTVVVVGAAGKQLIRGFTRNIGRLMNP